MSDQTITAEAQSPEEPVATSAQLQLGDIVMALRIIQTAASRGAFPAEEFTQVGGVYDRVYTFLRDSGAIKPPSEPVPAEQQPAE
jgi:hypothetical protein